MQTELSPSVPDAQAHGLSAPAPWHYVAQMDETAWWRWGAILLVAFVVAYWHQRQHAAFHRYIRRHNLRSSIGNRLQQLAYNRSLEMLLLFIVLLCATVFYDTRLHKSAQDIQELQEQLAHATDENAAYAQQLRMHRSALEEAQRMAGLDETQQDALDALKQRYEDLFINYYVLKRCNASQPQDFHIMNSALVYELNRLNAAAGVRQNILNAARGSYEELYAELACDTPEIGVMRQNMQQYLQSVIATIPDA